MPPSIPTIVTAYARSLALGRVQAAAALKKSFARTWPELELHIKAWDESVHHRGQPGNAGQFGSGGGSTESDEAESTTKKPTKKPTPKPSKQAVAAASKRQAPPASNSNIQAIERTKREAGERFRKASDALETGATKPKKERARLQAEFEKAKADNDRAYTELQDARKVAGPASGTQKSDDSPKSGKPMTERLASYKGADKAIEKLSVAGKAHQDAVDRHEQATKTLGEKSTTLNDTMGRVDHGQATQKELNRASKEFTAAQKEYRDSLANLQAKYEESKTADKAFHEEMKAKNPINAERVDRISAKDPEHGERSAQAFAFVKSIVERGKTSEMAQVIAHETPPGSEKRAYFSGRAHGNPEGETVNTTAKDDVGVHVHELGHYLEHNVAGVKAATHEFLQDRVGTEKPQKLQDVLKSTKYESWEEGRKDNFDRAFGKEGWYVGKVYDSGSTEVLSMGLEKMHRDPSGFAVKDPEYFKFIHGILTGSLRKEG